MRWSMAGLHPLFDGCLVAALVFGCDRMELDRLAGWRTGRLRGSGIRSTPPPIRWETKAVDFVEALAQGRLPVLVA